MISTLISCLVLTLLQTWNVWNVNHKAGKQHTYIKQKMKKHKVKVNKHIADMLSQIMAQELLQTPIKHQKPSKEIIEREHPTQII